MIDWLVSTRGYARAAAYVLCSAAVDLRLTEVVDGPNELVSALIPLDISRRASAKDWVAGMDLPLGGRAALDRASAHVPGGVDSRQGRRRLLQRIQSTSYDPVHMKARVRSFFERFSLKMDRIRAPQERAVDGFAGEAIILQTGREVRVYCRLEVQSDQQCAAVKWGGFLTQSDEMPLLEGCAILRIPDHAEACISLGSEKVSGYAFTYQPTYVVQREFQGISSYPAKLNGLAI